MNNFDKVSWYRCFLSLFSSELKHNILNLLQVLSAHSPCQALVNNPSSSTSSPLLLLSKEMFKNTTGSSIYLGPLLPCSPAPPSPRAPPAGCATSPSLPCWLQGVLRAGDLHSSTLPTLLPSSSPSLLPSPQVAAAPPGSSPTAPGAVLVAGVPPWSSLDGLLGKRQF